MGNRPCAGQEGQRRRQPRRRRSQAEVGPLAEDRRPQGAPLPWPGPTPAPQARWPRPYLGHCILLWAPRSQGHVRLEGSERRIRSQEAGAKGREGCGWCGRGGGADTAACGQQWLAGHSPALFRTNTPSTPGLCSPRGLAAAPATNGILQGKKQVLPTPGGLGSGRWPPLVPGFQHLTPQMQSQASRGCQGPGQRLPSALAALTDTLAPSASHLPTRGHPFRK